MSSIVEVAVGLRVKTGHAVAVVLAGPAEAPRAVERRHLRLDDPRMPKSTQPYHVALERSAEDAEPIVARAVEAVRVAASRALRDLVEERRTANECVRGVGLVVGSDIDPDSSAQRTHARARARGPPIPECARSGGGGTRSALLRPGRATSIRGSVLRPQTRARGAATDGDTTRARRRASLGRGGEDGEFGGVARAGALKPARCARPCHLKSRKGLVSDGRFEIPARSCRCIRARHAG